MSLAEDALRDRFAEDDERAARAIERRAPRNQRYAAILERELRQTRDLVATWRELAITACVLVLLLGIALWSKW